MAFAAAHEKQSPMQPAAKNASGEAAVYQAALGQMMPVGQYSLPAVHQK